jgi:hypothetical protein
MENEDFQSGNFNTKLGKLQMKKIRLIPDGGGWMDLRPGRGKILICEYC